MKRVGSFSFGDKYMVHTVISCLMCVWIVTARTLVFKGNREWGKLFEIKRATPPVALTV